MKIPRTLFWAIAPVLLLVQISQATPSLPPIFNVHESIQSLSDVLQLQETMSALKIQKTILQGIPKDILYYTNQKNLSLADSDDNNGLIEQVAKQTRSQGTFGFFCTIDPLDLNRVTAMEDCLKAGGRGIKLYNGYSYAHVLPVDDQRLSELYQKLSDDGGVLMLALNAGDYKNELENVLTENPTLPVICPHYCLSSQSLDRLTDLMTRHTNLYIDTSFGQSSLAKTGFETLAQNHDQFEQFFADFQDRILFGTDNVVTDYEGKDATALQSLYQNYVDALTQGLNLPYPILRKVLWQNASKLLE